MIVIIANLNRLQNFVANFQKFRSTVHFHGKTHHASGSFVSRKWPSGHFRRCWKRCAGKHCESDLLGQIFRRRSEANSFLNTCFSSSELFRKWKLEVVTVVRIWCLQLTVQTCVCQRCYRHRVHRVRCTVSRVDVPCTVCEPCCVYRVILVLWRIWVLTQFTSNMICIYQTWSVSESHTMPHQLASEIIISYTN